MNNSGKLIEVALFIHFRAYLPHARAGLLDIFMRSSNAKRAKQLESASVHRYLIASCLAWQ
jgi:hypothetical protein